MYLNAILILMLSKIQSQKYSTLQARVFTPPQTLKNILCQVALFLIPRDYNSHNKYHFICFLGRE